MNVKKNSDSISELIMLHFQGSNTPFHLVSQFFASFDQQMARPISVKQQQDPREYELQQLRRRYKPQESTKDGNTTILKLGLVPSDPDFPFELESLQCELTVPQSYRTGHGKPSLRVQNPEMERGYQINIEEGFRSLAEGSSAKTLLNLMNDLDRNLESFLTPKKAQTVKIRANARLEPPIQLQRPPTAVEAEPPPLSIPFTSEQEAQAQTTRALHMRQLEARLGRDPRFSASTDGLKYVVPLQIPKPNRLPLELQSISKASLLVPKLYNLQPCAVRFEALFSPAVQNVEAAFLDYATANPILSLVAKLNHLAQNMHVMASKIAFVGQIEGHREIQEHEKPQAKPHADPEHSRISRVDQEKPHIEFIPRPPEWDRAHSNPEAGDSSSDLTTDSDLSYDEDSDKDEGGARVSDADRQPSIPPPSSEHTISLTLPNLELHGVELLELPLISVIIRCGRCKETTDFLSVPGTSKPKMIPCHKCLSPLTLIYHAQPMHQSSQRAGLLSLPSTPDGTTITDLLPSTFTPTCSSCSTPYTPTPPITAVRGDEPRATCRTCHTHLSISLPEVKFLRQSTAPATQPLPLRARRPKENLGITANTALPNNGRCTHYSKSYRWFRFSCCQRVYACDRCHDAAQPQHANEHANRMICGWCSREQNYRPEDCGLCGRSLVKRAGGGGFWEGGKGTRDKVRMSRKDPRKFKRRGGGTLRSAGGKGGEKRTA